VLKHIAATQTKHDGAFFVRTLQHSFVIQGFTDTHQCLVLEPLLASLYDLQKTLSPKSLVEDMLRTVLQQIFPKLTSYIQVIDKSKFKTMRADR